jgi:hypothetical protein
MDKLKELREHMRQLEERTPSKKSPGRIGECMAATQGSLARRRSKNEGGNVMKLSSG